MSDETPKDKTAPGDSVSLAVEKIAAAMAQGDQCSGMAFGKNTAELKAIFTAAAQKLKMPVFALGPLQGGTQADIQKDLGAQMLAFRQAAGEPAMILYDASGNNQLKDPANQSVAISNFIQGLTVRFPKAVYIQLVADERHAPAAQVNMYCMNPKTPRDPSGPIYPV